MQRRADRRGKNGDDRVQRSGVESYTGVGISVSFNSKVMDEQQKVQQLSGGQKSEFLRGRESGRASANGRRRCCRLVRSVPHLRHPADGPEPDGGLRRGGREPGRPVPDGRCAAAGVHLAGRRHAVHLHHVPPEIVHVADKCYGVTFTNKTSSIDCVPTEEALSFVEGQKQ